MASNSTSLSDLAHSIFSYNNNIMLAALISLLLVVLFVLLLHAYANCFFPHPRLSRSDSVRLDSFSTESKGLDPSTIAAIPLFVYESEEKKKKCATTTTTAMECAICLSEFEEREMGRRLAKCRHGFHVECIDMWLNSHADCPVCRTPVLADAAALSGVGEMGGEIRSSCEIHEGQNGLFRSSFSSSSADPPLMTLGESLKRMLSRSSRLDGRIFPSSNGDELDV